MTNTQAAPRPDPEMDLAGLRREIDGIDLALHRLLIERGTIIDRLIAVKAAGGGGSAFRPAREAAMMRALVTRHHGLLPLDTVEGIWRIIISTFTYVQAPYAVHADVSGGDAAMRDSCRFHFGFTVPLRTHAGARAVVAAVAAAAGDLGLVHADGGAATVGEGAVEEGADGTPWWHDLEAPDAPKIIARLPFVERADHAAGLPLYVVAKPLRDAAAQDMLLYALTLEGAGRPDAGLLPSGVQVVNAHPTSRGTSLVVAAPATVTDAMLGQIFAGTGRQAHHVISIGSHSARFEPAAAGFEPTAASSEGKEFGP